MDLFGLLDKYDYGSVHVGRDAASGMQCIVALHDTRLGPAIGGCRFLEYPNDREALIDALRLARGMTYKAALAGLPHGGGKTVLLRPGRMFDRAAIFRAFGRFINGLGGRYYTAEDSGTGIEDMEVLRSVTKQVVGTGGGSGDPSPFTALGVRRGIEACVKVKLGRGSLEDIHVAVQGVGHVGYHLCRELHGQGARLTVADIDHFKAERVSREFGAQVVPIDQIFDVECDVLAPCALGSALNDQTIPRIRAAIVAGAANNQLAEPRHGDDLNAKGLLYAPDYAINAGGLINVALELTGYSAEKARAQTMKVYDTIAQIAERSLSTLTPTYRVADLLVEEKLATAGERLMADPSNDPVLCDNPGTLGVIEEALGNLWSVANTLSRIKATRRERYTVTLFGSARIQPGQPSYEEVKALAHDLAGLGCDIVSGGGPGLMQAANEGAQLGDPADLTKSIGIRIALAFEKESNPFVDQVYTHQTFFTRLQHFVRLSDAFVVFGGGLGTLLELSIAWQLLQVRHIHDVPLILVGPMWRGLVAWAKEHMLVGEPSYVSAGDLDIPICVDNVEEALLLLRPRIAAHAERRA